MFMEHKESWSKSVRAHRTVYRFGSYWQSVILAAVPWLNLLILLALLVLVHGKLVITPGIIFTLPSAPLREGSQAQLIALMMVVSREGSGGEETLVFFDDERYSLAEEEELASFTARLKTRLNFESNHEMLLLADKHVPHGDVMRFVNTAREAGVKQVNVAEKPQ